MTSFLKSQNTASAPQLTCGLSVSCDDQSSHNSSNKITKTNAQHHHQHPPSTTPSPALKAIMKLLYPRAQAACRSSTSAFAVAFTALVDEESVAVASKTNTSQHLSSSLLLLNPTTTRTSDTQCTTNVVSPPDDDDGPVYPPSHQRQDTTTIYSQPQQGHIQQLHLLPCHDTNCHNDNDEANRVTELCELDPINQATGSFSAFIHPRAAPPSQFSQIPTSSSLVSHSWNASVSRSQPSLPHHLHHQQSHSMEQFLLWAPASLSSPHLQENHLLINIEVLALQATYPSFVSYSLKPSTTAPRVKYMYVYIMDGFCAYLNTTTIEYIGMSKVVTIANGLLAGSLVKKVIFGSLPRLVSIGNECMAGSVQLTNVKFVGEKCPKLQMIGDRCLMKCSKLASIDLTPFSAVSMIGVALLAQCDALTSADFSSFTRLTSVGNCWLYDCCKLTTVCFDGMVALYSVGEYWIGNCFAIKSASFRELPSLRFVGRGFGAGTRISLQQAISTLTIIVS